MKVRSIKSNYFLSILRIISSTIIGVFTMPYINNVLGPESLGKVEYVNSIVTYFILFSALGIPVYGIRQIAKVRENPLELSNTLVEILIILFFTSIIAYLILFGLLYTTDIFFNYKDLIFLMSSMILLNNLGAEWFFQGIEDQLYITIRYLSVRVITVILLFMYVEGPDDYLAYALVVILNFCGSGLLNFFRLRRYLILKNFNYNQLNFTKHIKPSLTIFVGSISVSIYLQIDNFLLGYLSGDKYVGLYAASNKLLRYVIGFIISIGSVLLPRLSNLWIQDKESYYIYLRKAFSFMLLVSIPCSIYFYFFSEGIINFMAGREFRDSILTLKILSPICVLVSLAYFFGYLVLYTQSKEKFYTIAVSLSAFISISINYFLISDYQQNGAAMTQVVSELIGVLIILYFILKNKLLKNLFNKNVYKILFSNSLLIISVVLVTKFVNLNLSENFSTLILSSISFFVIYVLLLFAIKEQLSSEIKNQIKIKSFKL